MSAAPADGRKPIGPELPGGLVLALEGDACGLVVEPMPAHAGQPGGGGYLAIRVATQDDYAAAGLPNLGRELCGRTWQTHPPRLSYANGALQNVAPGPQHQRPEAVTADGDELVGFDAGHAFGVVAALATLWGHLGHGASWGHQLIGSAAAYLVAYHGALPAGVCLLRVRRWARDAWRGRRGPP